MDQPSSSHPDRIWVIQQYLNGNLPDDLLQQVDQRRQSDPEFDQQVLAQGLLAMYAENERDTRLFYEQIDQLTTELKKTRGPYKKNSGITYLYQLIMPLAAILALVFIWAGWYILTPPVGGAPELAALENDKSSGFGERKVSVIRYDHLPGLQGLFQMDGRYKWPGDTLFLYGKELQKIAIDSLLLSTTDANELYQLRVGQQKFLIRKGQAENRPLEPDETP